MVLHEKIDGFLGALCGEIRQPRLVLNKKHEATISVEVSGNSLALSIAVENDLEVCQIASLVGVARGDGAHHVAHLAAALSLSIADLGGLSMAMTPPGHLYLVGYMVGEDGANYAAFRALFSRLIESSLAWKTQLFSDPVYGKYIHEH